MNPFSGWEDGGYWHWGQHSERQSGAGGNTVLVGSTCLHWLLFSRRLVVYRYEEDQKDLAVWATYPSEPFLAGTHLERMLRIMSFLSKRTSAPSTGPVRVLQDKEFPKRWPCLFEHLTVTEYPDGGGQRATSTITLFLGATGPVACLNDKDNEQSCFGAGTSFLGALDALEAVAKNPDTVWKADKVKTGSSARRK